MMETMISILFGFHAPAISLLLWYGFNDQAHRHTMLFTQQYPLVELMVFAQPSEQIYFLLRVDIVNFHSVSHTTYEVDFICQHLFKTVERKISQVADDQICCV